MQRKLSDAGATAGFILGVVGRAGSFAIKHKWVLVIRMSYKCDGGIQGMGVNRN